MVGSLGLRDFVYYWQTPRVSAVYRVTQEPAQPVAVHRPTAASPLMHPSSVQPWCWWIMTKMAMALSMRMGQLMGTQWTAGRTVVLSSVMSPSWWPIVMVVVAVEVVGRVVPDRTRSVQWWRSCS